MSSILSSILLGLLAFQSPIDSAEADRRPDILLLLTDQHLASAVGYEGTSGFFSPAIDRLAAEGVVFRQAFCPSPQCSPSRASLLTGLYPHRVGVVANIPNPPTDPVLEGESAPLVAGTRTLGHVLGEAGYETAYFGKWHLGGQPSEFGFEHSFTENFYGRLTQVAMNFLRNRRPRGGLRPPGQGEPRRPLFLVASWLNPHDIYNVADATGDMLPSLDEVTVPPSWDDDLSGKPAPQLQYLEEDQGVPFVDASEQHWLRYRAFYSYLVEEVDNDIRQVGQAFREVSPDGLVILSADHGDFGGAHGLPYKGPAMYEELLRVPLIFNWPGRLLPGECNALVSLIDLFPTLCEVAEAELPPGIDGMSLVPLLEAADRDAVPWREAVFAQYYGKSRWRVPIRCVRKQRWKYVLYRLYGEELYDLESDPYEMNNLANDPAFDQIRFRLAIELNQWIVNSGDSFHDLTVTDRDGNEISG